MKAAESAQKLTATPSVTKDNTADALNSPEAPMNENSSATKSWAKLCSSEPLRKTDPKALPSVPKKGTTQPQSASTPADLPVLSMIPTGPTPRTLTPPAETLQAVADDGAQLVGAGSVLSERDFPITLPASPPASTTSPVVSYAKVAQSPPKPVALPHSKPNVPPQPDGKSELPTNKETSVEVHQPLVSLYVMIRQERQGLLKGPQITLYSGKDAVKGISKRAAMATSSVLNDHFVKNPQSLEYHLSAEDAVSPGAIRYLLDTYICWMSQFFKSYKAPVQKKFRDNIAILRAARKLGMEPYTKDILTAHVEYLKECIPTYEEIATVEANKTSEKDPLWTHMLNHLCFVRHKGYIPDPNNFEIFLKKHPILKQAMEATDRYFWGKGQERKRNAEAQRTAESITGYADLDTAKTTATAKTSERSCNH
jgi:hypothetical protein